MDNEQSAARRGLALLLVAVAAGGALGATMRGLIDEALGAGDGFPWATLTANVTGTLGLAGLARWLLPPGRARLVRGFLGTGVCGALTTFSTFQVDALALVRGGRPAIGLTSLAVGVIAGAMAVAVVLGKPGPGVDR